MYCQNCGNELKPEELICPKCGLKVKAIRKKFGPFKIVLISLLAIIVIIISGYFGYKSYRLSLLKNELEKAIGKDAGYTETILKIEQEATSMTYQELFDLCDKSVDDRTNLMIELRGLYPDIKYELKDNLIEFLSIENELVRNKKAYYRYSMLFSTDMKLYNEHESDYPSSSYGWDYYFKRSEELMKELKDDRKEILSAGEAFINRFNEILIKEDELDKAMNKANIRFQKIFEKYKDTNLGDIEKALETIKSLQ